MKAVSNMKYKGGLWPAITSDGHYTVNFGEEKMQFGPPDDSYSNVLDKMKNTCMVQDICEFVIRNRTLVPNQDLPTGDDIDKSDIIYETDRLVFTGITSSLKSEFLGTDPKQIRLKPTRIDKLNEDEDARNVKEATKLAEMKEISVVGNSNLQADDIEVSISSYALHYLVCEGIHSEERMDEIIEVMVSMINQKDGASRLPIEIASQTGNNILAMKLWQKMKSSKKLFDGESELKLAMKAKLWAVCKDLIEAKINKAKAENKDNTEVKEYLAIDENHALHYAAKYSAPDFIWKIILGIDPNLIKEKGERGRTIFHDLAKAYASKEIIDCITEHFKDDTKTIEDLFSTKEDETKMLPIHYAAACRVKKDLLETYIKFSKSGGMDSCLLSTDAEGLMPIHWALHYDERICKINMVVDAESIEVLLRAYWKLMDTRMITF